MSPAPRTPPAPLLIVQDLVFLVVTAVAHGCGVLAAMQLVPAWALWPVAPVTYPLGVLLVVIVLDALVPSVPPGRHPLGSSAFIKWGVHLVLYRVARLPPAVWL